MSKRVVVEIQPELHRELRKLAVLNDLKIYELTNTLIQDCIHDEEHLKLVIKKSKMHQ
jgi:hypothetical protein